MAPLALTFLYAIGGALIAGGIYTIAHGAFPAWIKGRLLWPLINVTPVIATLQGWSAVSFGVAVLAFSFAPFAPAAAIQALRALALLGLVAGSLLFLYSTWLSRRPTAGSVPPRS